MTISGIVKSSLIDFPGNVSCVLFTPGCNYNCFYCHNRALIDGADEKLDPEYVKSFLEKRAGMLDGAVISGGEPTLQPDLIPFIKWVKSLGYRLKLDSNGSNPEIISEILSEDLCDYYAIDYKAPAARYKEICGERADPSAALKTISLLRGAKVPFEVRTTVIPQLSEDDLKAMAEELPVLPKYVLNKYRVPEKYDPCEFERITAKPYTKAQIKQFADNIRAIQPNTIT
jgi:pyruvate formate lyase activating enzyme